jgi:hypothetical protein
MAEPGSQPAQIRIVTVHLVAVCLGLAGTALALLQGRYWLAQAADLRVLALTACVPLIAAVAFAIAPRHAAEDDSRFRPLRSWTVWGNLLVPVLLTMLTLILVAASGHFENFAGFAILLAANAGRNLRDFIHHLRHPA